MEEQYIVFINNNQKFALYVSRIEKIIEYQEPKKLPDTSDYFLGVIQYNGKILPIIDLSKRLYNLDHNHSVDTKIIVVLWKNQHMGIVVDDIMGIRSFIATQFEEFDLDIEVSSEYIVGFIKSHGDIIVTLDMDKIFSSSQGNEISLAVEEA